MGGNVNVRVERFHHVMEYDRHGGGGVGGVE